MQLPPDVDPADLSWPFHQWLEQDDGTLLLWLGFDRTDRPHPDGGHRYFGLYWRDFAEVGATTRNRDDLGKLAAEWVGQVLAGQGAGRLSRPERDEVHQAVEWIADLLAASFAGMARTLHG